MLLFSDRQPDLIQSFRSCLSHFSGMAEKNGIKIMPFSPQGPLHFERLSPELQYRLYLHFSSYVSICAEIVEEGRSLRDDSYLLWRYFKRQGILPNSELLASVDSRDVIEIYSPEFTQLFRNLKFFSICSYTLDQLLCLPFWELFTREQKVTASLMEIGHGLFTGKVSGIHQWNSGIHTVEEISSPALYTAKIENKIASALHAQKGGVVAVIHTFRVLSCESRAAHQIEGKDNQ